MSITYCSSCGERPGLPGHSDGFCAPCALEREAHDHGHGRALAEELASWARRASARRPREWAHQLLDHVLEQDLGEWFAPDFREHRALARARAAILTGTWGGPGPEQEAA